MRDELKHIERIERYIEEEMDSAEKEAFENEMQENPELKKETEFYKNLRDGISRQALKLDIKKAQYKYLKETQRWARLKKFLFGGGSFLLTLIVVTVLVLPDEFKERGIVGKLFPNQLEPTEIIKAYNEDPYKDYLPESELFSIKGGQDTTITSADGIRLYLPKGSLRLPDGSIPQEPITIEIADGNYGSENMLGNLIGDEDLNVEDVVFVNAKAGDKQLIPDNETPPYLELPTPLVLPNKKVYSGTKAKDGSMKWDKPKLPENYLVPHKYQYLDYYPDSFEATVNANLPYNGREVANRTFLDSLFFATLPSEVQTTGDPNNPSTVMQKLVPRATGSNDCGINTGLIKAFANEKYEQSLLATREFMQRLNIIYKTCDKDLLNIYINNTDKQLWEIDEMAYDYLVAKENSHSSRSKSRDDNKLEVAKASFISFTSDNKLLAQEAEVIEEYWGDSVDYEAASYSQYFKEFSWQKLTNVPNSHVYAALIAKEYEKDLKAVLKEQKQIEKEYKDEIKANTTAIKAHEKRVKKYKKLTTKRVKSRMQAYGFKVTTLGWKAIAELQTIPAVVPEPLYVNIKDFEQFDHYHTYFAVTELNVIGKLNKNGDGQFIMNEHRIINLPRYNTSQITLLGVGFKGKAIHIAQMPYSTEKSGTETLSLELKPTDVAKKILDNLSGRSKKHSIWYDMEQQKAFYAEKVRRQKLAIEEAFRRKIHNIIYPCCAVSITRPNAGYEAVFEEIDVDNTMWEYRTGIKVIHKDGKVEYIFKHKDPARFQKYFKMSGGKNEVFLPE